MANHLSKRERDDNKLKGLIEEALDNLTENPSLPDGIPTLLDIPERRPLPPYAKEGRPSLLVRLVKENPKTYESYILALKKGAFFHTAAAAIGIPIPTINGWAGRGKKDAEEEKDTYYSRFYYDVLKAVGQCRVAVEQSIATMQPWKWLAKGPGKVFGTEWSDTKSEEQPEEVLAIQKEEPKQIAHDGTGVEVQVLKLDTQTEAETLAEIEKAIRDRKEVNNASTQ